MKTAGKCRKHVRFEAVQRFLEEFVSQLEIRIKDGDQTGFYKHLKGMCLEGRKSCSVQYIKDGEGILLRCTGLIRERWVQWFSAVLYTKSPALDLNIVEELKVWPSSIPLDDLSSTF